MLNRHAHVNQYILTENKTFFICKYGSQNRTQRVVSVFTIAAKAADSIALPTNAKMCLVHENGLRNCNRCRTNQKEKIRKIKIKNQKK